MTCVVLNMCLYGIEASYITVHLYDTLIINTHPCSILVMLKIAAGHWAFSYQFEHLTDQNPF